MKRKIIIGAAILVVIALIVTCIIIVSNKDDKKDIENNNINDNPNANAVYTTDGIKIEEPEEKEPTNIANTRE